MIQRILVLCLGLLSGCATGSPHPGPSHIVLAIHGGAGAIRRADQTAEQDAAYHVALEGALRAGYDVLQSGGSALDAVVAAILPMEDSPLFNSGYGAVLTAERRCELDASIMDGNGAGAVAGVTTIKHPILAARTVMDHSEHVLLPAPARTPSPPPKGLNRYPIATSKPKAAGANWSCVSATASTERSAQWPWTKPATWPPPPPPAA